MPATRMSNRDFIWWDPDDPDYPYPLTYQAIKSKMCLGCGQDKHHTYYLCRTCWGHVEKLEFGSCADEAVELFLRDVFRVPMTHVYTDPEAGNP